MQDNLYTSHTSNQIKSVRNEHESKTSCCCILFSLTTLNPSPFPWCCADILRGQGKHRSMLWPGWIVSIQHWPKSWKHYRLERWTAGFLRLTCFKLKVKFVSGRVKRSRQGNPHLEVLSSANNEVIIVVLICVVLGAIFLWFAFHQVYWSHCEKEFCENIDIREWTLSCGW